MAEVQDVPLYRYSFPSVVSITTLPVVRLVVGKVPTRSIGLMVSLNRSSANVPDRSVVLTSVVNSGTDES